MKILIFALIGLLGVISPAQATPPRYAILHDTPLAVSQTHIYLLRLIEDNKGSYYIRNSHRFLIAQNLETGAVDRFWLLDTSHEESVDLDHPVVEIIRAAPSIDLLGVLVAAKAAPLAVQARRIWQDGGMRLSAEVALTTDGIQAGEGFLSAPQIQAWIAASLAPVFAAMPVDPGPTDPMQYDNQAYSHDLADCLMQEMTANIPIYSVYRLDCENGDFSVLSYGIYLTIPDQ